MNPREGGRGRTEGDDCLCYLSRLVRTRMRRSPTCVEFNVHVFNVPVSGMRVPLPRKRCNALKAAATWRDSAGKFVWTSQRDGADRRNVRRGNRVNAPRSQRDSAPRFKLRFAKIESSLCASPASLLLLIDIVSEIERAFFPSRARRDCATLGWKILS